MIGARRQHVCSITSIESLAGFRVLFDYVGARDVFSSINETFSRQQDPIVAHGTIQRTPRAKTTVITY